MLSFDKNFTYFNLNYSINNTYRYIDIYKHRNICCDSNFKLTTFNFRYLSPVLVDFNNSSILGVFLIIKLLTGQFPYISKYKMSSTFKEVSYRLVVTSSLNMLNSKRVLNWFCIQFINPLTNYNVNVISEGKNYFALKIDTYNLLKQISVHPLFFKWTEPIYITIGFQTNVRHVKKMLKLY